MTVVPSRRHQMTLTVAALGIVFGDIGTSPLYALKECFFGPHAMQPTPENVLGVLSLIFWSLILVVTVKYLAFVLSADNRGEGGILALMALTHPGGGPGRRPRYVILLLGLFGAALLYGDGVITPAISVLGAVEGLTVAPTGIRHVGGTGIGGDSGWVVPVAATRHRRDRRHFRSGHVRLVRHDRAAGARCHRAASGGAGRHQPVACGAISSLRNRLPGFLVLGARIPDSHRRRGAVRRHGALRRAADSPRLVLPGSAGAVGELLRPGRAAAGATRRPP